MVQRPLFHACFLYCNLEDNKGNALLLLFSTMLTPWQFILITLEMLPNKLEVIGFWGINLVFGSCSQSEFISKGGKSFFNTTEESIYNCRCSVLCRVDFIKLVFDVIKIGGLTRKHQTEKCLT